MDGLTGGDLDIYRLDDESWTLPLRVILGSEYKTMNQTTATRVPYCNRILLDILSVVPLVQIPASHDNPSDHYIQR